MVLRLVTPAAETPVSLAEAKRNADVEHDLDNDLITGLIAAATDHLDGPGGILGMALVEQTWRLETCRPACAFVRLPLPPVSEITDVEYLVDGEAQTLDAAAYRLSFRAGGEFIVLNAGYSWPAMDAREDALRVTFKCGATAAPAAIRQAMLLLVTHWYENRGVTGGPDTSGALPFSVKALLAPHSVRRL